MNNMDNLGSYDHVEYIQGHHFSDKELRRYCDLKMSSAQENADFIEQQIYTGKTGLDICEIGGGNGKLLYCLEKRNLLKHGVNYEVSNSRCLLASRFADLLSCYRVENRNQNFLEDKTREDEFDCIIMVDIVLQIIVPLYDLAEEETFRWVAKALKKHGYLYLEIIDYSYLMKQIEKEGVLRIWEEFPQADPFEYCLQKMSLDQDHNLVNEKCFIQRDSNARDYFKNVIHSYTPEQLEHILDKNGFSVTVYPCCRTSGEQQDEYMSGHTYRILARKK